MKRLQFTHVFTLLLVLISTVRLSAQQPDSTFWVPNGPVNAVELFDTTVIIGGHFDQLAPVTGSFLTVDTGTAVADPNRFKVNGSVYVTYMDVHGYLYVGGNFSRAGNQNVENIFRLKPNGNFDNTFNHSVNGPVFSLCVHDTDLFIGGSFSQIDGVNRNNFGGIDLNSGNVNDCDPDLNGPVYCMGVDTIYNMMVIGGGFTSLQTFSPPYIAKIGMQTGAPYTFNAVPWTAVPNANGPVYDLQVVGPEIYIAGEFTNFASTPRRGLAMIHTYNGYLQSLNANIVGSVYSIELIDTNIYLGGSFGAVSSQVRNNLACVNANFVLQPWNPGANAVVRVLTQVDSNRIFAGGDFTQAGGDTCVRGALINAFTGVVDDWNPQFNATVFTAWMDTLNHFYVGGSFFASGGILRNNLCALSVNTGTVTAWNPNVNNTVHTFTLAGDTLYFAGDFSSVGGTARGRIAAINLQNATLTSFNPGVNGLVRTMAVTDSAVYVGGNFTQLGGQARMNIGKVDKASSQATPWYPACFGTVNRILIDPSWVYVAGFYSTIAGVTRQNLARIDPQTAVADWNWICDTDDGIYEAQFYNGKLAIGGWFSTVNGQAAGDFAILDTASLQLAPVTFSCDGFVRTFTTFGDDFFIAGNFDIANAQYQPRLIAYDEGNDAIDPWTPAPNATPTAMRATATRIYLGGSMTSTGSLFHPFLQVIPIQYVTAVQELHGDSTASVKVWPVPASESITLHTSAEFTVYTITDLMGNTVQSGALETGSAETIVPLSGLATGMYIVTVEGAHATPLSTRIIRN